VSRYDLTHVARHWWPGAGAVLIVTLSVALTGCSGGESSEGSTTVPPSVSTPATAPPGSGTGGVTIDVNPVPVPLDGMAKVKVSWEGQKPRTLMFVSICRSPSSTPGFQAGIECSSLSELNPNGTPDGSGSVDLEFFRGRTPDGDTDWGCFAPGDEAPSGVQVNTTCYVRVTNDVLLNNAEAKDAPFTITNP